MSNTTPTAKQQQEISKVIELINKHAPNLTQKDGDSPWTKGKTIFCFADSKPGDYVYMVGALANGKVTFHLMPMYGNKAYQSSLTKFITGKSCIEFENYQDLPEDVIIEILEKGTVEFQKVVAKMNK
jgi:hypothetical protein